MFRLTLVIPLLIAGCAPYTDAQLALITQARRGLELVEQSNAERDRLMTHYHQLQRHQLDDAFDDDVRQREPLDPAWVIDHRRAYAAALDALSVQHLATRDADAAAAANIQAISQSLDRLESLVSLPSRILTELESRR